MSFRVRVPRLLFLCIVVYSALQADQLELVPLSFDSLYPKTEYTTVEQSLKELWSDLDLLYNQHDLHTRFIYESDYLVDQYLMLERQLATLVSKNEDFCSYLLEDIHYLAFLIDQLERKSDAVCTTLKTEHEADVRMAIGGLLMQCREHITELFANNKEVSA